MWTKEQAVANAPKGGQAYALKMAEKKNTPSPGQIQAEADEYVMLRLSRVRAQLDLVDREIRRCASEPEQSRRLRELVEAQSRLSDQEFALANRPKPGNSKPADKRPASRPSASPEYPTENPSGVSPAT